MSERKFFVRNIDGVEVMVRPSVIFFSAWGEAATDIGKTFIYFAASLLRLLTAVSVTFFLPVLCLTHYVMIYQIRKGTYDPDKKSKS